MERTEGGWLFQKVTGECLFPLGSVSKRQEVEYREEVI